MRGLWRTRASLRLGIGKGACDRSAQRACAASERTRGARLTVSRAGATRVCAQLCCRAVRPIRSQFGFLILVGVSWTLSKAPALIPTTRPCVVCIFNSVTGARSTLSERAKPVLRGWGLASLPYCLVKYTSPPPSPFFPSHFGVCARMGLVTFPCSGQSHVPSAVAVASRIL